MVHLITAVGLLIYSEYDNEQFYVSWDNVQSYKVFLNEYEQAQFLFILNDGEHMSYSMPFSDKTDEFLKQLRTVVMTEVLMRDTRSRYHYNYPPSECGKTN